MSSEEKTRPIEQLSVSLTNSDSDLESPSWHHDALRQTAQRYEGGHEQPIDWPTAKGELRKLAERTSLLDHSWTRMPQFVRMQSAMCVRKTVVGQGTYMLAPRSYRLLVSALGFALLASIAPNARAANPPDDLAKFLFLTQLGDMPDNAVVCPSFAWKPIPAALLQSLQVADSRFVRVDECVKVMDVRIGSYHRPSGRHAFFFSIHDFRMLADGRAVAKIDQYFNGKWATYETVEVRESAGQWSLVRIFDRWQS